MLTTASNLVSDPKTILVVDDDLSVLSVIKCILESGDYNLLMANSAKRALRMADRDDLTIDLMLIDVVMPDVSGPDLAERILAVRPNLKVLFMSGYTAPGQPFPPDHFLLWMGIALKPIEPFAH